jgi:CheY-like chemotaxis protein
MACARLNEPMPSELPKVLVIDDEASNLETFGRVFRKDFAMHFASSVAAALELLQKQAFDIALVDYAMPGANGVAFLRKASELPAPLACVLLTAHGDVDEVKQACAGKLAHGIILKPWKREAILRWVSQAVQLGALRKSVGELKSAIEKK